MDIDFIINTLITIRRKDVAIYAHMRRYYGSREVPDLLFAERRIHGYSQLVRHHVDAAITYLSLNDYEQGVTQVKAAWDIMSKHGVYHMHKGTDELCALFASVLELCDDSVKEK